MDALPRSQGTDLDCMLVSSETMQSLHFSYKTPNKTSHIPSLGLALVLLISLVSPTSSCTEHEKASLLQFLAGLSHNGGLAASWQYGTDCCKWEGITCRQDRTVTDILLASKGLAGYISPSLGHLTRLLHLDLSHNSLSGGLPVELVSSSSITILDLSFNQLNGALDEPSSSTPAWPERPLQVLNISTNLFTGEFSSSIWKAMENLIALNASNNSFTGQVPTQLCNTSPSITVLDLCFNKFSGSISLGLGNCSRLRELRAGYNHLSGTLPDDLFNATMLEYLSFPNNGLNGGLDSIRMSSFRNLVTLDLGGNNFSGKIPDSIGQLNKLEELVLKHPNSKTGSCEIVNECDELLLCSPRLQLGNSPSPTCSIVEPTRRRAAAAGFLPGAGCLLLGCLLQSLVELLHPASRRRGGELLLPGSKLASKFSSILQINKVAVRI